MEREEMQMTFNELMSDIAGEKDAFMVLLTVVDRAMAQVGVQAPGDLIAAFEKGTDLPEEERQKYAYAVDQRFSEMGIEGWTRLRARLNNAEAHILRQLLVDNGVGIKLRGVHQTAADVLRPSSRAEIWIRPWDVSKAQSLMPDLDGTEEQITCEACGETNPSHFAACWQCGQLFGAVSDPVVD